MLTIIGMIESENWMWATHYNDDERCSHSSAQGTWRNESDVLDPYMNGRKCKYNRGTWDDSEPEWEVKIREKEEAVVKREEKRQVVVEMDRRGKTGKAHSEASKKKNYEVRVKRAAIARAAREKQRAEEQSPCWLFQTEKEKVAYICNEVITQGLATHDQRERFYHRFHALPREKQKEIRQQLVLLYYKKNLKE